VVSGGARTAAEEDVLKAIGALFRSAGLDGPLKGTLCRPTLFADALPREPVHYTHCFYYHFAT